MREGAARIRCEPAANPRIDTVAATSNVSGTETNSSAKPFDSISRLPAVPAIYAMYGGDPSRHVAYVGKGKSLIGRVGQHLVRRDSSVVTGTTAVGLRAMGSSIAREATRRPRGRG